MRRLNIFLILCFVLIIGSPVMAKNIKGKVGMGAYLQGDSDEKYKAGEYRDDKSSPSFQLKFKGGDEKSTIYVNGDYIGPNENDLKIRGNFLRYFKIDYSHDRLYHRKPHNKLFLDKYDTAIFAGKSIPLANGTSVKKPDFSKFKPGRDNMVFGMNPFFPDPGYTMKDFIDMKLIPKYSPYRAKKIQDAIDADLNNAANFPANQPLGAQVFKFEDTAVSKDYYIKRTEENAKFTFSIPNFETVKLHFSGRYENRYGYEQRTPMVGKCTACHVRGLTKKIDETTREIAGGISLTEGPVYLSYTHFYRTFDVSHNDLRTRFDKVVAIGPYYGTNHGEIFIPRLNYDAENGEEMPVSKTPESRKHMDTIKLRIDFPHYTTFAGMFTDSNIKNRDNDLEIDQTVVGSRLTTHLLKRKLTLSAKFRYLNIDSDDIFIDMPAINNPNDPAYPDDPNLFDWTRKSAIDRNQYTFGIDLMYRMLMNRLKFRLGYEYDKIDRDNFDVYYNEDTTETNILKAGIDFKPFKKFYGKFRFKYTDVNHPFANLGSACIKTTLISQLKYDPKKKTAAYPKIFVHDDQPGADLRLRTLDGTASPETSYDYTLELNFNPVEKLFISLNGEYVNSDNNEGNSDWDQDKYNFGIMGTYNLSEKFTFSLGYNYAKYDTDAILSVDLFGG